MVDPEIRPRKTLKVDRLKVQVYETRSHLGAAAGADVAAKMKELLARKQRIRMVFAAAPSQDEVLQTLREANGIDWSRVVAFHMDEYVGLPEEAPQKFGNFLRTRLFDRVRPGEVNLIQSSGSSAAECQRYADLLSAEPVDIVCLGIGENGHIAFNDPPVADFDDPMVVKSVELDEASRRQQVNDGCFASIDEVPTRALTLTIPTLMSGAYLFCAVPGRTKRRSLERALRGPITIECPASILRCHPACLLYADTDAHGG